MTAMHTYVSELKRCRSRDGKYPYEAPDNEVSSQEAPEHFSECQKRFGIFRNDCFKEAKSASITARVYFDFDNTVGEGLILSYCHGGTKGAVRKEQSSGPTDTDGNQTAVLILPFWSPKPIGQVLDKITPDLAETA